MKHQHKIHLGVSLISSYLGALMIKLDVVIDIIWP